MISPDSVITTVFAPNVLDQTISAHICSVLWWEASTTFSIHVQNNSMPHGIKIATFSLSTFSLYFWVSLKVPKCSLRAHLGFWWFLLPGGPPKCRMLRVDAMDPSPSSSRSSTHLRPKRMATVANLGTDLSEVAMWAVDSQGWSDMTDVKFHQVVW